MVNREIDPYPGPVVSNSPVTPPDNELDKWVRRAHRGGSCACAEAGKLELKRILQNSAELLNTEPDSLTVAALKDHRRL